MLNFKGITFEYLGDRVTWLFPWRKNKNRYYSFLADDCFDSLLEIKNYLRNEDKKNDLSK